MTEYIIIVAIIAIGAILIIGLFGQQIKGVFTGMGHALGGRDDKASSTDTTATGQMDTDVLTQETMGTFDEQNQKGK
jgi:Flp pilus assembly pilin Flp